MYSLTNVALAPCSVFSWIVEAESFMKPLKQQPSLFRPISVLTNPSNEITTGHIKTEVCNDGWMQCQTPSDDPNQGMLP